MGGDVSDTRTFHTELSRPVGSIVICDLVEIHVIKKPSWLARLMMRWLLQWRWEDYKP